MALFWKSRDIIRILFQMLIQKPGGKVEDQMWHIKDTFEDWKDWMLSMGHDHDQHQHHDHDP